VIYAVVAAEAGMRALAGMPALSSSALAVSPVGFLLQLVVYAGAIGVLEAMARAAGARQREQEIADLRARRLELENDLRDAQLEALRAKLSPHFLFNALQSVTALMRVDPVAAEGMLSRLGDVLRMALRLDLTQEITLGEELDVARAYLELEQVRFRDRLTVTIDVDEDLRDALVPSLILQPVVENGIRHGVSVARTRAELLIEARRVDGDLLVGVGDNGPGFGRAVDDANVAGVGLGVLRSRLEKLYPGRAACSCGNRPGGGAIIEIRLPFHTSPAEQEAQG
jgi:LytS/YehU family sensor histidine kinase